VVLSFMEKCCRSPRDPPAKTRNGSRSERTIGEVVILGKPECGALGSSTIVRSRVREGRTARCLAAFAWWLSTAYDVRDHDFVFFLYFFLKASTAC